MEIRIYKSMQHYTQNKPLYVSRVECPDAFNYSQALDVFRSIYGSSVIIVFLCL